MMKRLYNTLLDEFEVEFSAWEDAARFARWCIDIKGLAVELSEAGGKYLVSIGHQ